MSGGEPRNIRPVSRSLSLVIDSMGADRPNLGVLSGSVSVFHPPPTTTSQRLATTLGFREWNYLQSAL